MKLSKTLQTFKEYAEELGLETEVTELSERTGWLVVKDPTVSGGYLQIIQTRSGWKRETTAHSANVAWIAGGSPKDVTLRSCRGIMKQFAGFLR